MAPPDNSATDGQDEPEKYTGELKPYEKTLFVKSLNFDEDEFHMFKQDCEDLVKRHFPEWSASVGTEGGKERAQAVARYGLYSTWLPKLHERLTESRIEELCSEYLLARLPCVNVSNKHLMWHDPYPPELQHLRPALALKLSSRLRLGQPLSIVDRPDLEQSQPYSKRGCEDEQRDSDAGPSSSVYKKSAKLSSEHPQQNETVPMENPTWGAVMLKINLGQVAPQWRMRTQSVLLSCCSEIDVQRCTDQEVGVEAREVMLQFLSLGDLKKAVEEKLRAYGTPTKLSNMCFRSRCYGPSDRASCEIDIKEDFIAALVGCWREPRNRNVNKSGLYEWWLTVEDLEVRALPEEDDLMPSFKE